MENFVVSARKYRPVGFEEVVGQGHITTTLENAIKSNHLGQALLFCGPRGVGKTTCARILAKTINDFDAGIDVPSNFNIFELDAASNNSVEDIRNLIDQVRYPPQQGQFKVYIIDEVHMLSAAAFNAFLKTLEEPPSYAIFILATTEKHKVLPTILSRCQIYDFNRIEIQDIVVQLQKIAQSENITAETEALHLIAQKADGAMRDALSFFDLISTYSSGGDITYQDTIKNLNILDYDYFFKLVDFLLAEEMSEALLLFDQILRKGFEGHNFLNGFQLHIRNLLVAKDPKTKSLLDVSDNLKGKYTTQASATSHSFLLSSLNLLNQFEIGYKQSRNQRLHVELCLMKLSHLSNAISLANGGVDVKKKSITNQHAPDNVSNEPTIAAKSQSKHLVKPIEVPISSASHTIPITSQRSSAKPKETPSIFGKKKEVVHSEKSDQPISSEKKSEKFSQEDINSSWAKFKSLQTNAGDTEKLILSKSLQLESDNTVIIQLNSHLEASFLDKMEASMIQFLRKELNNDAISLQKRIAEVEDSKKLYTSSDIYDHMVSQNPHLKEMKDRLGLDFDY